eukprot:gene2486-61198_t
MGGEEMRTVVDYTGVEQVARPMRVREFVEYMRTQRDELP